MDLTTELITKGVKKHIITQPQADKLKDLATQLNNPYLIQISHLLSYFGAVLAIGAMAIILHLSWMSFGSLGLLTMTMFYTLIISLLARYFYRENYKIPGDVSAILVTCLTPVTIFAVLVAFNGWPELLLHHELRFHQGLQMQWIIMEIGTLVVATLFAFMYHSPYLLLPILMTLWFFFLDIFSIFMHQSLDYNTCSLLSSLYGLALIVLAVYLDIRSRFTNPYALYFYLLGVVAFVTGLITYQNSGEIEKILFCLVNLLVIGLGIYQSQRTLVVFGALGLTAYIGHLFYLFFQQSSLLPIGMAMLGILMIALGIWWQKNECVITKKLHTLLPRGFKKHF